MELPLAIVIVAIFIQTGYAQSKVRKCDETPPYLPETTVHTTERLKNLRAEMSKEKLDAYIIPSTDAHGSEYVRVRDKRRKFISGFSGSAGDAIVTKENGSALWTDGRYFLQADMELDCNWILQKSGVKGVPSQTGWLKMVLKSGARVGIDPFLMSISVWDRQAKSLMEKNITLVGVRENLVDKVWATRPAVEKKTVDVQPYIYTGKRWSDKVTDLQKKMSEKKATAHVVQELDSIAWLLNLRGSEIPYNPVFFAYAIVKTDGVIFFVDDHKIAPTEVKNHLMLNSPCTAKYCITTKPYNSTVGELAKLSNETNAKIWLSPKDSYALRQDVPDDKVYLEYSPIRLMKAMKNDVELKGMKYANLKDSAALSQFFMWAENQVKEKKVVTELSLEAKMEEFRSKQDLYKKLSFASIVGFGENGAVIHYRASNKTNKRVFDNSTLLVDTGSQYLDGSTDVTRTVHFGEPTARQKQAFTRVLMGQIDLASAVFPQGTYGRAVDIFAREALFRYGWNYRHGTGHGIGAYLYIHEGPGRIASGYPPASERPLSLGMVFSDEPGYYEVGSFGIRIETAVVVVNASTPNRFGDVDYYKFEPICWFPVQRKLIDETIMTNEQIEWINWYHKKTEELVGAELQKQKKTAEYKWLLKQTQPIKRESDKTSHATATVKSISLIFIAAIFSRFFV